MIRCLILAACLFATMRAEENVLRTAAIPNRVLRQGEAQLLALPDGQRVLRIQFHTRHLARIEAKILGSETQNWPESPDSARYQTALRAHCAAALRNANGPVDLTLEWAPAQVRILQGGSETLLADLDPAYLQRNRILIVMDLFGTTEAESTALLTP